MNCCGFGDLKSENAIYHWSVVRASLDCCCGCVGSKS